MLLLQVPKIKGSLKTVNASRYPAVVAQSKALHNQPEPSTPCFGFGVWGLMDPKPAKPCLKLEEGSAKSAFRIIREDCFSTSPKIVPRVRLPYHAEVLVQDPKKGSIDS